MHPTLRPLGGPVLATLALHIGFIFVYLSRLGGDPSALICTGENRIGRYPFEAVGQACGPNGHDGQFYYLLARAPWQKHEAELDAPPLRHVRILYPAVCWLLSAGHPVVLFYVMPAVNLLAVAALAALGARLALVHGRSAWWGFALPLGVNAGISLTHNFTDCVSSLAVFGLLAAWLRGEGWPATTLWAVAAVFAREQNVAVVGLVGLAALWKGRLAVAAGAALAGALWIGWVAVLWGAYGGLPFLSDGSNLNYPLAGVLYRLRHLGDTGQRTSVRLGMIHLLSTLYLLALLGAGLWALHWRLARTVALLLAGGVALALLGGPGIYIDFSSYLRVYAWVPIGLWLAGLTAGRPGTLALLAPGLLWSLVAALRYA
jgi:hypothetical protein